MADGNTLILVTIADSLSKDVGWFAIKKDYARVGAGIVAQGLNDVGGDWLAYGNGIFKNDNLTLSTDIDDITNLILGVDLASLYSKYETPGTYTWTNPVADDDDKIIVVIIGAGGGTGGSDSDDACSGGGAGAIAILRSTTRIASLSIVVGVRGAGAGSSTGGGTNGGASSVGGVTAGGGGAGTRGGITQSGGAGGAVSGTPIDGLKIALSVSGSAGVNSGNGATSGAGGMIAGFAANQTAYLYGVMRAIGYGVFAPAPGTNLVSQPVRYQESKGCGGAGSGYSSLGGYGGPGLVIIFHAKTAPLLWSHQ